MSDIELVPETIEHGKQFDLQWLPLFLNKLRKNRVAQNSLISTSGFVVSLLVMLVFTPVLVHRMGPDGYGLWSVSVSVLGMMGMLELGLGVATAKYLAEYYSTNNREGISAVVSIGLIANLLIGFLLTLPLYFFAPQIARLFSSETISGHEITQAIQLSSFGFLPLLLRNTALSVPDGLQRFEFSTIVRTTQNILIIVAALVVVVLGGTIQQVVLSTVLVMGTAAVTSIAIAAQMLQPLVVQFPVFKRSYARQMFSFMAFAGLRGVGAQLFSSVDRIAVGAVLGLSGVAYYTICIGVANKFVALSTRLTQALMPAVSTWYAKGETNKVKRYFIFVSGVLGVLNLIGAAILIVFASKILTVWMGAQFTQRALVPFQILVSIYAIKTLTAPASQVANGIGKPWINAFVSFAMGAGTVSLIIILGRQLGLIGAAVANIAAWTSFFVPIMIIRLLRTQTQATS